MLKRYTRYTKLLLIAFVILASGYYWKQNQYPHASESATQQIIEHPIYGTVTLTSPLEIEILQSPTMERLKKIHQYGITYYAGLPYFFSRYDHSVGVFLLLKRFGLTQNEQIAGMLHDASHTAFSHVAEAVFNHTDHHHSYQDTIHRSFLESQGIGTILKKYNLTINDIMHKETDPKFSGNGIFKALEQDLPDLCADRIDYIIEGGVYEHVVTQDGVNNILDHLRWNGEKWFFTDVMVAKKFADIALYLTENVFSHMLNNVSYQWIATAINKAFEIGLFSQEEFCTSVDALIWEKLESSKDATIQEMLYKIINWEEFCEQGTEKNFDKHYKSKFRGVDPLVEVEGKLVRLTSANTEYAECYNAAKKRMQTGTFVKFIKPQMNSYDK